MKGYIYRAYLPSGMSYIGSTKNFEERKKSHWYQRKDKKVFHVALRLFGKKAFDWEIIEIVEDDDTKLLNDKLWERENYWINYYDLTDCGLNDTEQLFPESLRNPSAALNEKRSKKMEEEWSNEEHRRSRCKKMQEVTNTESYKEIISTISLEMWQRNGHRDKVSKSVQQSWEKRRLEGKTTSKGQHWKLVNGKRVYYKEEQ